MKNKNKGAKMTSKLSNEFYLLHSFVGEVRRNEIQRRPMAVMPYRMTDGKNYPVTVIQVEPTDWAKS
tara:strand:+ start:638 stop:838 length:201 start_codon:yes stop_codon:yes gene_type:complete